MPTQLLAMFTQLSALFRSRLWPILVCLFACLNMYTLTASTTSIASIASTSGQVPSSEIPLFSHPEQIAHVSGESEACHQMLKYFQPVSGQWSLAATDLTANGAEPIALQRILLSPSIKGNYHKDPNRDLYCLHEQVSRPGNGWTFLPEQFIQAQVQPEGCHAYYVTDSNGITLAFTYEPSTNRFRLDMDAYGMNNGIHGLPSSQYDCRNSALDVDAQADYVVFTAPDGVQRFYRFPRSILCRFHTGAKGWLEKTRLKNGTVLRYSYDHGYTQITRIESFDPTETHLYATLSFSRDSSAHLGLLRSFCNTVCKSNTGAQATWQEEIFSGRVNLKYKIKHGKGVWELPLPLVRLLRSSSSSQNGDSSFAYKSRFTCSDLHVKEGKLRAEYGLFGSDQKRHYRIKTILKENEEGAYKPLYHFDYTLAEAGKSGGSTCIKLSDGSSIVYQVNKQLLVDRIAWKDPAGNTRKEERFVWNPKQWCERKELYADHVLVRTHGYSYDERGNPTLEEISGDLTGEPTENGSSTKNSIRRTYSQDALSLPLSEERDNGRIDRYSYLPGTDRLQSHFVCKLVDNKECICQRVFFVYDAHNQLIEKRIDNGSSTQMECLDDVTQWTSTCWKLRQQAPFLHLPEQKEDYVLDQGKKQCIGRSCYTYDKEGNVAAEERYDGNGQLLDTILREYNARGDVLAETNNLGQQATYTYDSYGRKTEEVPFSADRKIQWLWDNQGRCRAKAITGFDGLETRYTYSYDLYDAQTEEVGPLGERTERGYSPLLGQLTHEQKPSTFSLNENNPTLPVVIHYTYDGVGRLVSHKNANGTVTKTHYTAYGKPHTIFHADDSKELFRYASDGHLERYTDREGMQTHYKRDIWDRVIAKSYTDAQGNLLGQESWDYDAFHLLRKIDKEGHITEYTYDAQGRKIQEDAKPSCTRWKYDARGDVKEIIYMSEGNGLCNSLHVHMQRDTLGRVIETHSKDDQGRLLKWEAVSYDLAGRVATQEFLRDGQRVIESFTYDSQDRVICHQDCNGAITTTQYGERTHVVGGKTHRVETKRVTSPEGELTEIRYDHAGREWVCDQWDSSGRQLLRKENEYDPEGNLLYHREWLYEENKEPREEPREEPRLHTIARTYTQDNLVASSTRAAGSDQARTTKYLYSPEGRLISREEPSSRSVHYIYDGLGFLRSIKSSDQTVDQQLQVNRLGHLIKSIDGTTGLQLVRTVDRFGHVLSEVFPFGKQLSRQYDARGRLQELEVTGLGSARYVYDSLFLRTVEKLSPQGELIALHCYTDYDQDGWLNQERLAGGLGSLRYRRDSKGRLVEIQTPHGTVSQVFDAQDRLVNRTEEGKGIAQNNEPLHTSYTYDGLSQLLSEEDATDKQRYEYDTQGSRLTKNGEQHRVNLLCEELFSGMHQFAYDLDGNRIEKTDLQSGDTWTYTYNALHQCTEAYSTTCRVQFAYDALYRKSRRILERREDASQPWTEVDRLYFLYQGIEEIGSYRETGECTSYRVLAYPESSIIPRTVYIELEGNKLEENKLERNWYVPQLDAQGSITHLLDPRTAALISLKRHTAFGEVLSANLSTGFFGSSAETSVSSPWGYFSKRLDPDLGLIDFGKRWYDPQQARWTTLDPAGFVDGTNLYRFVRNNPLLYTDPDGQFAMVIVFFEMTAAAITWIGTTELCTAIVATAAAYGLYRTCDHNDPYNDLRELRRQESFAEYGYFKDDPTASDDDQPDRPGKPPRYWGTPGELAKNPDWEKCSHPNAEANGRRSFKNKKTGQKVHFDDGKPGKNRHGAKDHYHIENPDTTNRHDEYIDSKGNACGDYRDSYHIYPPEGVKWER